MAFPSTTKRRIYSLHNLIRTKPIEDAIEQEQGECGTTETSEPRLKKKLGIWDVIGYGIGASVGCGIFINTGSGALVSGPGVALAFLICAIACAFNALCYCEFAVRVPLSGSAYTFAYVCLGELAAWFIGWNLSLEYAISAAVVGRGFASSMKSVNEMLGLHLPSQIFEISLLSSLPNDDSTGTRNPNDGPIAESRSGLEKMFGTLSPMGAVVVFLCSLLVLRGSGASATFSKIMSAFNVTMITTIIVVGAFYVDKNNFSSQVPSNYNFDDTQAHCPEGANGWLPCGFQGVMIAASKVFFSYIGFDCITVLVEEVKNPKRDMPVSILTTLFIATSLYVCASLVVCGMVPWWSINKDTPFISAFDARGLHFAAILVGLATLTTLATSTLASLFGQPRVFLSMARDGLLPQKFAQLDATGNPRFGAWITCLIAILIAFFMDLDPIIDLIDLGILLMFTCVCAGVILLRYASEVPVENRGSIHEAFLNHEHSARIVHRRNYSNPISYYAASVNQSVIFWLSLFILNCFCFTFSLSQNTHLAVRVILGLLCLPSLIRIAYLPVNQVNIPKNFTCPFVPWIPAAAIFSNLYLISSQNLYAFINIGIWTGLGLIVYFVFGIRHSKLNKKELSDNSLLCSNGV